MSEYIFRHAKVWERQVVLDFINQNFDWRLPLVNREELFSYYYMGESLRFVLALNEHTGEVLSVAGYIPANRSETPDVWVSVWAAKKGCNGVGLELMNALPELLHARVAACNNIRPKTMAFYRFLGWEAGRVPHYYRLGTGPLRLANVPAPLRLAVGGDLRLDRVSTVNRLHGLGLPPTSHTPAKDLWHLGRRYFAFPHYHYDVWSVCDEGRLLAYLVTRAAEAGPLPDGSFAKVLRLVDFVGEDSVLPRLGRALDGLLAESGAEYLDCYNVGIPAEVWRAAGLTERQEGDGAVIPNYLEPPLFENTEYYYFTNKPKGFVLFRADGDQDRPNLTV